MVHPAGAQGGSRDAMGNTAFDGGHTETRVEISTENEAMGTWEGARWTEALALQT